MLCTVPCVVALAILDGNCTALIMRRVRQRERPDASAKLRHLRYGTRLLDTARSDSLPASDPRAGNHADIRDARTWAVRGRHCRRTSVADTTAHSELASIQRNHALPPASFHSRSSGHHDTSCDVARTIRQEHKGDS